MKELKMYSSEYIMNTPMKPIEYCVDGLISQGLFILAGAPKVGKSWLALDMCLSIAKGEVQRRSCRRSRSVPSLEKRP